MGEEHSLHSNFERFCSRLAELGLPEPELCIVDDCFCLTLRIDDVPYAAMVSTAAELNTAICRFLELLKQSVPHPAIQARSRNGLQDLLRQWEKASLVEFNLAWMLRCADPECERLEDEQVASPDAREEEPDEGWEHGDSDGY
jgi:hypothetical protein